MIGYEYAVRLYQEFHGISDTQMPSELALRSSPGVRRLAYEATKIVKKARLLALREALRIIQISQNPEQEILSILDDMVPPAVEAIKEAEVIELTEVHGGGLNLQNSNPTVQIKTVEEAIQCFVEGKISGFQIGGYIEGRWSPVGVVRKWGTNPQICQIKQINSRGQEGSGVYDDVDSISFKKFLRRLIDLSTISPESKLHVLRKTANKRPLTEDECTPQFKAL